ncbi:MAG: hypothetical protein HYV45_03170 [Candidatus Moranbacteria bacterium]|nr:hypothetical protein [Candidatus Moranbacteria bacterium]
MTTFSRRIKQCVIAIVYITLFSALSVAVYYLFIKAPETCFDGKKNQNEEETDCGGVCTLACQKVIIGEDIEIRETAFVVGGVDRFDVLAKIYNPNDEIGAAFFTYVAELRGNDGVVLGTYKGQSFILPQETKYLVALNIETGQVPVSAVVRIENIEWAHFSGYQEKPRINIYQKRYSQISSGVGFGEAYGLLANESPYDFRAIIVKVILRDAFGKPLAFNTTEMRTVTSREERDFRLVWPTAFPGDVANVEMEVDADVYHSDNFTEQYLPGGRFQELAPSKTY